MKRSIVRVRWTTGLHLRPAAQLVRLAQQFRSSVLLQVGARRADLRSLLAVISLCAMAGTTVSIEASGEDEERAVQAIEQFFETEGDGSKPPGV
jgi:phosphotransferase system HPr (HPr) family protein